MRHDAILCAIVIWPNGEDNLLEIISTVSKHFEVKKIYKFDRRWLKKVIKLAYSHDYAPRYHLRKKTKYLSKLKGSTTLLIVKVPANANFFTGKGLFRHLENALVRDLKTEVREKFNPKDELGNITHNHVIHATDNDFQARLLISGMLSIKGINLTDIISDVSVVPHHIKFSGFEVKELSFSEIYGRVFTNTQKTQVVPLRETPHYKFVTGDKDSYRDYLYENLGYGLTDYYSLEKFSAIKSEFKKGNVRAFSPLIRKEADGYVLLDGLHRTSLSAFYYWDYKQKCTLIY